MKIKNKAQSEIIAIVLIIVLILVAVAIVWNVYKKMIKDNTDKLDLSTFNIDLEIKTVYKSPDGMKMLVEVERKGKGNITLLKFLLKDSSGATYVYTVDGVANPTWILQDLETKIYSISPSETVLVLTNFNSIVKVAVAFGTKLSSGKDVFSEPVAEGDAQDKSHPIIRPINKNNECADGTVFANCSVNKPWYCDASGNLYESSACEGISCTVASTCPVLECKTASCPSGKCIYSDSVNGIVCSGGVCNNGVCVPVSECTNGQTRSCTGSNPCKSYTQTCTGVNWPLTCTTVSGNNALGTQCTVGGESGSCDGSGTCLGSELIDSIYVNSTIYWNVTGICTVSASATSCSNTGTGNISEKSPFAVEVGKTYKVNVSLWTICGAGNSFTYSLGGIGRGGQTSQSEIFTVIDSTNFFMEVTRMNGYSPSPPETPCVFKSISVKKVLSS